MSLNSGGGETESMSCSLVTALEQVLSRMILRIISCSWTAEVVRGQEGAAEPLFNGLDDLQHEGNGDDDAAGKKVACPLSAGVRPEREPAVV